MTADELGLDNPLIIFGRDVRKIPCFRNSFLYGIGSGLASGLVVFMFTSKPRLSCNSMVGTFSCVTLTYWIVCRHRWAQQKFSMGQILGATRCTVDDDATKQRKKEIEAEVVDV